MLVRSGGNLPSKQTLRAYVIRQLEFNDAHVNNFIGKFFETVSVARLDEPAMMDIGEEEEEEESSGSSSPVPEGRMTVGQFGMSAPYSHPTFTATSRNQVIVAGVPSDNIRLPVPLPTLRVAWFDIPRDLSELEFTTLVNSLTMFKDALIAKPQMTATLVSPAGITQIPLGDGK